jgi:hypothetical protein
MVFIFFQVLKVVKNIERTGEKTEGNKSDDRFSKQREIEDILGKNYGSKDKKVFDPLLRTGGDENFFGDHLGQLFLYIYWPKNSNNYYSVYFIKTFRFPGKSRFFKGSIYKPVI